MPSRAKAALVAGEPLVAVNPGGASVDVAEMPGRLGVGAAFIDCERTAIGIDSLEWLVTQGPDGLERELA